MNKNILILIIILVVIATGFLTWHFWPEETTLPIEELKVPAETPKIIDCGISEPNNYGHVDNLKTTMKDSAIKCLGESLTKNCTNAKAVIQDLSGGPVVMEIKGTDLSSCKFRFEFPDKEKITQERLKAFANSWVECPVRFIEGTIGEIAPIIPFEEMLQLEDGAFAIIEAYIEIPIVSLSPEEAAKSGCSGTLLYVYDQNINIPCKTSDDCKDIVCPNPFGILPSPMPSCVDDVCKCGDEWCEEIGGCE